MNTFDSYGVLLFMFGKEKLAQAAEWTGYIDNYPCIFDNPTAIVEGAMAAEKANSSLLKAKLHICQKWEKTIRIMAAIGVKDPELAFLVSDLYHSDAWLLKKGIVMHGGDVIADIINEFVQCRADEISKLTSIITSRNPYEAARNDGIAYAFSTENSHQNTAFCSSSELSMSRLSSVLDIESTREEKLSRWSFEIRKSILDVIQGKNIDINLLAHELGIDHLSFVEKMVHFDGEGTFYLQALSLAEHWDKPDETEETE